MFSGWPKCTFSPLQPLQSSFWSDIFLKQHSDLTWPWKTNWASWLVGKIISFLLLETENHCFWKEWLWRREFVFFASDSLGNQWFLTMGNHQYTRMALGMWHLFSFLFFPPSHYFCLEEGWGNGHVFFLDSKYWSRNWCNFLGLSLTNMQTHTSASWRKKNLLSIKYAIKFCCLTQVAYHAFSSP